MKKRVRKNVMIYDKRDSFVVVVVRNGWRARVKFAKDGPTVGRREVKR
jgi:hypothetical protein